ncbi:glycosyltransferase family 4 protein [Bartonella sp. HY329]|uniref:glycosyltransferase family 4 protein n=1 Tax=unclassified Bartonella TaxID=2645622 RepID=UPI0021C6335E|nr:MULTISPECIES: glycosyltransferase family 4 protein [unclassified Bartonella]UXM94752.1 glycosyltransferase family 4 protein [Bartonella sp. HY329]UXN09075.1 glycosyltransferase family 4 protein [Bartonella sp. HY328]
MRISLSETEVIAPNFKKRLSGVTSTIVQLIPLQRQSGVRISTLGPGLPNNLPSLSYFSLFGLWKKPKSKRFRIWHARRNVEMIAGILMRDILRMKIKLIFTSAAQRDHKSFTKFLIRRMDRVIATSARSGSYLQVPHKVIMHGVDLERFHPPRDDEDDFSASGLPGKYAIGCFGRVRHQKGTDLFVDAMIELLPNNPGWTAVITGRTTSEHADFEAELRKKIAGAGLEDRIFILGEVPDVRVWYRRVSLYVAPSRNEGFGLTPLEAMASQTAVVASDAGAYAELITPQTGSVVAAGDGRALTKAIAPWLADIAHTKAAGVLALEHVREAFPLSREADAIADVYDELFTQT